MDYLLVKFIFTIFLKNFLTIIYILPVSVCITNLYMLLAFDILCVYVLCVTHVILYVSKIWVFHTRWRPNTHRQDIYNYMWEEEVH